MVVTAGVKYLFVHKVILIKNLKRGHPRNKKKNVNGLYDLCNISSDKISKNIQVEQLGNSRDGLRLTWVYFRCMDTRGRFGEA